MPTFIHILDARSRNLLGSPESPALVGDILFPLDRPGEQYRVVGREHSLAFDPNKSQPEELRLLVVPVHEPTPSLDTPVAITPAEARQKALTKAVGEINAKLGQWQLTVMVDADQEITEMIKAHYEANWEIVVGDRYDSIGRLSLLFEPKQK